MKYTDTVFHKGAPVICGDGTFPSAVYARAEGPRRANKTKSLPTSFIWLATTNRLYTDVADDSSHVVVVQREKRALLGVYFLKTRAVLAARWLRAELS